MTSDADTPARILITVDRALRDTLRYVGMVVDRPQKEIAAELFEAGLRALLADPAWRAKAAAHEERRATTLAALGVPARDDAAERGAVDQEGAATAAPTPSADAQPSNLDGLV